MDCINVIVNFMTTKSATSSPVISQSSDEQINMDFNQGLVINTIQQEWQPSPCSNVWRKHLERQAAESGHTTSIVRFNPDSFFPSHEHPMGEEILVLDGIFSDEFGDYETGSYIRNPPHSKHTPFSRTGCTLFVKLYQFDPDDRQSLCINTQTSEWLPGQGGLQVMPLHDFRGQHTALVKWPAGERFQPHTHFGGEEILVLSGEFIDEHGRYPAGTWLRSPHMSKHFPFVEQETIILVKVGHLPIN